MLSLTAVTMGCFFFPCIFKIYFRASLVVKAYKCLLMQCSVVFKYQLLSLDKDFNLGPQSTRNTISMWYFELPTAKFPDFPLESFSSPTLTLCAMDGIWDWVSTSGYNIDPWPKSGQSKHHTLLDILSGTMIGDGHVIQPMAIGPMKANCETLVWIPLKELARAGLLPTGLGEVGLQARSGPMSSEEKDSDNDVNPKGDEPREGKDQALMTFLEPLDLAILELTLPRTFAMWHYKLFFFF